MNNQSKEIQQDLNTFCKKYNIERAIFMFEHKPGSPPPFNRVILFETETKQSSICDFAYTFQRCADISKTFQALIHHVNEHSLEELAKVMKPFKPKTIKAD